MLARYSLKILFLLLLLFSSLSAYWQQSVKYDIQVSLDDQQHLLHGHERLTYINNSPDSLNSIWMHLWPNAYRDTTTALARQRFEAYSTRIYFQPASAFGWIELENLQANGQNVHWEYRSADTLDVARFHLNQPLAPGDTVILDMDFKLKIPSMMSRLGHAGNHYEMTQWYPKPAVYDREGWHPMSYLETGEFYSEWADFRVTISLPANYRVAATGILQDSSEISWRDSLALIGNDLLESLKVSKPKQLGPLAYLGPDQPLSSPALKTITYEQQAVHDFAWFADKRYLITRGQIDLPSGRKITSWVYSLPQNFNNYRLAQLYSRMAIQQYSDWFMEYPYEQVSVVDGDATPGGGMEYPLITLINNTSFQPIMEAAIIHEIAHNWFYGLSANNERSHPWQDEGLTSYVENRYWRWRYPANTALSFEGESPWYARLAPLFLKNATKSALEELSYYGILQRGTDQPATLATEEFDVGNYYAMTYGKASVATALLHAYLGDDKMTGIWHSYFGTWAYKHPSPEDLRTHFETVSGQDLSWYFDDMLGSAGKTDYALKTVEFSGAAPQHLTSVRIENKGDLSLPLPVALMGSEPGTVRVAWVQPRETLQDFTLETPFAVTDVLLDPENLTLDMDRRNNRWHRRLLLDLVKLNLNPQADYLINTIPYLWYNTVDGIIPGLIFMHYELIPWGGIDWNIRSYYGPRTETLGLSASLSKIFFPAPGSEVRLGSRVGRDWYYHLLEVSGSFKHNDRTQRGLQRVWDLSLLNMDISQDGIVLDGETIQYLDPAVWTHDQHVRLAVGYTRSFRETLKQREVGFLTTTGRGSGSSQWLKFQLHLDREWRMSRSAYLQGSLFAGYATSETPSQEQFYFSTDMDPSLKDPLVLSRNGDWYTPGHKQLYLTPYTLPGFLYDPDTGITPHTRALAGVKIKADIPQISNLSILLGTAVVQSATGSEWHAIASLSPIYHLGPWQLIYSPFTLAPQGSSTDWSRIQLYFDIESLSSSMGF